VTDARARAACALPLLPALLCRVHQAELLSRLMDAANGLAYLHDRDIIHGDLKAANVLLQASSSKGTHNQVREAAHMHMCMRMRMLAHMHMHTAASENRRLSLATAGCRWRRLHANACTHAHAHAHAHVDARKHPHTHGTHVHRSPRCPTLV
jgi:serine/threonine protein kinase